MTGVRRRASALGFATGVAALAAALTLTACGAGSGGPSGSNHTSATGTRAVAVAPAVQTSVPASTPHTSTPAVPSSPAVPWTPCTTNTRPHLVYVSIARQHLWMCAGNRTNYSSGITSGMAGEYTNTPTGFFTIQAKNRDTTLNVKENGTYTTYPVKYWIPFDAPLFGFHDSSWQTFPYGSAQYRTDGSHGCVHMPLAAIAHLYDWAPVGTAVTIVP